MTIHAYFDDSGKESDPKNRIVCAAGYIAAGPSIWQAFQDLWRNQLLMNNMRWLHMNDFMCDDSSEYRYLALDWEKKKPILEGFSAAIKMSQLVGFGVALDAKAWRSMPKEIIAENGPAQEFCFMRILRLLVGRMKIAAPHDRVSIVFDCDRNYTPARFQRYIRLRDKVPEAAKFLNSFAIAEPREFYPLQAADLLAWETRKDLLRQIQGLESRPEFKYMLMVLPGFFPQYISELWSEEELQKHIAGLQKGETDCDE